MGDQLWLGGDTMSILKKCSFYRESKNSETGHGIGYCDLKRMICPGDVLFCKNLESVRRHYLEQRRANK